MDTDKTSRMALNLRAGDIVEVRSIDEVLATLDERCRFEALPFMPEMLKFCGRRLRVVSRADKTCDRVTRTGIRTMTDTVHLEGIRCNGASHGGCEAACLMYWKEAWLKRAPADAATPVPTAEEEESPEISPEMVPGAGSVFAATQKENRGASAAVVYSCQATEVLQYTAAPRNGEERNFWPDVRCGNVPWTVAFRAYLVDRFNAFQRSRGGTQYPPFGGTLQKTPIETLDLQAGELVQIKTRDEVMSTLDVEGKNRGLSFDREMYKFCGETYRVLRRVTRIIDEPTGLMMPMKRDCLILEGVTCESRYHGLCPKAIYPFFREIWLKRAIPGQRSNRAGEGSFAGFVLLSALQMLKRRLLRRRCDGVVNAPTGA